MKTHGARSGESVGRVAASPAPQRRVQPRRGAPPPEQAIQHWPHGDAAPPAIATGYADIIEAASRGTAGAGGPLPFAETIQRSFGRHDVSGVVAHTDAAADSAARTMGALAFTAGNDVAFAGSPGLHTAAHEAAHVVQQRAGIQLEGGVGIAGDRHERHADAVADRVIAGRSSEDLLDAYAHGARAPAVQHKDKDNEWTVIRADSPTVYRQGGKVFSTTPSMPDVGVSTGAATALLAVNNDGKTLVPLNEAAEIGTFVGDKVLRVRPARLIEDKDYPTRYRYSFIGPVVGILADGTKVLASVNGPPVAPRALPTAIQDRLDADSVVRASESNLSWSYIVIANQGQWIPSTHSMADVRTARAGIVTEYNQLPAGAVKSSVETYLPLMVAVATHEGSFDGVSPPKDHMASLGLFQWGAEKATNVGSDRTETLYQFFRELHDRAQAATTAVAAAAAGASGKAEPTAEQKLYIDAWEVCSRQGLKLRADGMLTLHDAPVTGRRLEQVMHRPMAKGALRTYQLVGALSWIETFKNRRIHPGTWPTTRARMGNGFDEPNRMTGDGASFSRPGFKLNLVATGAATVGSVMTSVKNLSKIVTLGVNRPFYVEAALWLAMTADRDPAREAADLLNTLQHELKAAFPHRVSFSEADVAGLSPNAQAALAELKALIWPSEDIDETTLLGRFESNAIDLWRADGSDTAERAARFTTVDALF